MLRDGRLQPGSVHNRVSRGRDYFPFCATWIGGALGAIFFAGQARANQECHLRMRIEIRRGRVDSIQVGLLFVRDFVPDFRCGSDFYVPVWGGVSEFARRRRVRDVDFCAPVGRRAGLGMGQRSFILEVA